MFEPCCFCADRGQVTGLAGDAGLGLGVDVHVCAH